MKKFLIPVAICLLVATFIIYTNNNSNQLEKEIITETKTTYYVIKEYNGRIALFVNNNELPKETYEIFTSSLPSEDAEKIRKGITVTNENDLQRILEDYTS